MFKGLLRKIARKVYKQEIADHERVINELNATISAASRQLMVEVRVLDFPVTGDLRYDSNALGHLVNRVRDVMNSLRREVDQNRETVKKLHGELAEVHTDLNAALNALHNQYVPTCNCPEGIVCAKCVGRKTQVKMP